MGHKERLATRQGKGGNGIERGLLVLALLALLTACVPRSAPRETIEPAYVFALGVSYDDVVAMLGPPETPPRYDRYSDLSVAVYRFPFDAVEADSRFPNGAVRRERTNQLFMFFDRRGALALISIRPNRYYPTISDYPVQKVTILPRLVRRTGTGVFISPIPPPPPQSTGFPLGWGAGADTTPEPEGDRR